jgi:hypothetical protein
MKHKYGIAGFVIALSTFIHIPSIASNYEDFPLTSGQVKFIKLIDTKSGTNFSKLIDTPNANRIISAATFACTYTSFQKKFISAAGGDLKTQKDISKLFETLFCNHLIIEGH